MCVADGCVDISKRTTVKSAGMVRRKDETIAAPTRHTGGDDDDDESLVKVVRTRETPSQTSVRNCNFGRSPRYFSSLPFFFQARKLLMAQTTAVWLTSEK